MYARRCGLAAACGKKPASIGRRPQEGQDLRPRALPAALGAGARQGRPAPGDRPDRVFLGQARTSSTVDSRGRLVAKKEGKAIVTATLRKLSAQIPVEVVDVKMLEVTPVRPRSSGRPARVPPPGGRRNSRTSPSHIKPVWTSSNEDRDRLAGRRRHLRRPRARHDDRRPRSATSQAHDRRHGRDLRPIARLEIRPATRSSRVGDSQHFEFMAYGPDGARSTEAAALFTSSDPAVATRGRPGVADRARDRRGGIGEDPRRSSPRPRCSSTRGAGLLVELAQRLSVRPPAVAGTFYDARPDRLERDVRRTCRRIDAPAPAFGAIVPHAGYVYSGPVAGAVYARLAHSPDQRRSSARTTRAAAPPRPSIPPTPGAPPWATSPWTAAGGRLLELAPRSRRTPRPTRASTRSKSSSPSSRSCGPDVAIVPICLGAPDLELCREIGEALAALAAEERTSRR